MEKLSNFNAKTLHLIDQLNNTFIIGKQSLPLNTL